MAFGETRLNRHRGVTVAKRPRMACDAHELAEAIVEYAIKDWRLLVKQKAWNKSEASRVNFGELRRFFKGEWCEFLLSGFGVTPDRILALLEAELQEAMQRDADAAQRSKGKMKRG